MKNTKNKKVTFLMPIIPKDFHYAKDFLESFKYHKLNKQADFYFVFSNIDDKNACKTKYNSIILPENLKDLGRDQGIINVKKFYGVYELKDKYDYVIVIDSESLIIKNIDLLEVCNRFFDNKTLWGILQNHNTQPIDYIKEIVAASSGLFDKKEELINLNLDFWFQNPCIYKSSTIENFFEKTNLKENLTKLTFWHFDYYIYMFYLYLYHEFKPQNLIEIYCGCHTKSCTLNVDFITKYMHIATPEKYQEIKRLGGGRNVFLLIQLDAAKSFNLLPEMKYKNILRRILSCFIPNRTLRRQVRSGY